MSDDSDNKVLKGKEEIVLDFVKSVSQVLELGYNIKVEFCNGFTPAGQKALACIDVDSAIIYISRVYLERMQIEEIRKIIIHEISHLFEPSHRPEFKRIMNEISIGTWTPTFSSGVTMIDGGGKVENPEKPTKKTQEVVDKTHCNYHLCRKKIEVNMCKYCEGYFCEEHIKPIPPNQFNEWNNRGYGHPCPLYYTYLESKHKEDVKKIKESFNKIKNLHEPLNNKIEKDNSKSNRKKSFWKKLKK